MDKKKKNNIIKYLKLLGLSSIKNIIEEAEEDTAAEKGDAHDYLLQLLQHEHECRRERRITRLRKQSKLTLDKTFESFDKDRLSVKIKRQLKVILEGSFLDRSENILIFGNPGSGKTHLASAISHALIEDEHKMIATQCPLLIQELLREKKEYRLEKILKKYSRFEGVFIDDIGYTQQTREEMEVFFNFLATRYESGSVIITSNLPFSKWNKIFKDSMTAAAAVDRLVHHSIIIELNLPSYRLESAKRRK